MVSDQKAVFLPGWRELDILGVNGAVIRFSTSNEGTGATSDWSDKSLMNIEFGLVSKMVVRVGVVRLSILISIKCIVKDYVIK